MAGEVASSEKNEPVLVELKDISKAFVGVQALDRLSLTIPRGEIHALLGANGAGKSTLIKILAGAVDRDFGAIAFEGRDVGALDPHAAAELGVVCLFQEPALAPTLNVEQNIFLGQEIKSRWGFIDREEQGRRVSALLREIAPQISRAQLVRELRTSERQLVALAKGLLRRPKLLILDEPSASMTDPEIQQLFAILRRMRGEGVSVLYVTHRLEEVFQISDSVTVLRDGRLVRTCPIAAITRSELVSMIAGRELRAETRRGDIRRGRPLLSVREAGRRGVFHGISFDVHEGEVVALAGLVGAGRTEIARAIFAADPLDEGSVRYPTGETVVHSPFDAVRAGVALLPEDRKMQGMIPKMTVGDNLVLSSVSRQSSRVPGLIDFSAVRKSIARQVAQLDIRPRGAENRAIETLSGGNQQKVLLGRAMESGANVLVLDEPTAGVDIGTKAEIRRLIIELAAEGKGVLLISSEMEEVLALADRILVIREGRLVRELVGKAATSFDVLKSALGEDERTGDHDVRAR